jgi:hypothetical protein
MGRGMITHGNKKCVQKFSAENPKIRDHSEDLVVDWRRKSKVVPLRSIEAYLGDWRYSSYSSLTSALEGCGWSASRPGRTLPRGKEPPVPIVQEAGWAPEPVRTQRLEDKSSAPIGIEPRPCSP